MEIELDMPMIRKLVDQESRQASDDITRIGPLAAYRNSLQRHDERLANAPDANTLACKNGCAWCCYFTVDARPVEVLNILETMQRLSKSEQQRILTEAAANSVKLNQLSMEARTHQNLKCPFLSLTATGGHCSVYAARPQTCRNYHATDVSGCKQSFEQPDNEDIDPDFAPLVYQTGGAHVDAFNSAMQAAGYDTHAYELNTAISAAAADVEMLRKRLESKQSAFTFLSGEEVPLEFIDFE